MGVDIHDYESLIEPIRHRMVNTIWKLVRDPDDTEDAVQEALERIYKKFNKICRHPNPTALILRMCINTAYDHLRRTQRKQGRENTMDSSTSLSAPGPSPAESAAQKEQLHRVLEAVKKLPRREAEAILLLAVEGFSYSQTAEAMACREATVRSMIAKARRRLTSLFDQTELHGLMEVQES